MQEHKIVQLPEEYQPIVAGLFLQAILQQRINDHSLDYKDRYADDHKKLRKHTHAVHLTSRFVAGDPDVKLIATAYEPTRKNMVRYVAYATKTNGTSVTKLVSSDRPYPPSPGMNFQILTMYNLFGNAEYDTIRNLFKQTPYLKDHPILGPIYQKQMAQGINIDQLNKTHSQLVSDTSKVKRDLNKLLNTAGDVNIDELMSLRNKYIELARKQQASEQELTRHIKKSNPCAYHFYDSVTDISPFIQDFKVKSNDLATLSAKVNQIDEQLAGLREQLHTDNPPINEIAALVNTKEKLLEQLKQQRSELNQIKNTLCGASIQSDQFVNALRESVEDCYLLDTIINLYNLYHY
jgi:ElaB/YqjD/DUF883 family membrane-anchored ribosome-binding protein